MDPLQYTRVYEKAVKFRCVDRRTVFTDAAKERLSEQFSKASLSRAKFERFWKKKKLDLISASELTKLIVNNFRYLFDEEEIPLSEGRFNKSHFAALYTAKDSATAKTERFHHLEGQTADFDYVVYSVEVKGKVADLRPHQLAKDFVLSDDYTDCHTIAEKLHGAVGGIAWYSARVPIPDGSCCAFFNCDDVAPRKMEETSTKRAGSGT